MRSNKQLRLITREPAGRHKCKGLLLMLTIMLASCSGSSSEDAPLVDDALGIPKPPGNVFATVYSSTDAELFWDAAHGWLSAGGHSGRISCVPEHGFQPFASTQLQRIKVS